MRATVLGRGGWDAFMTNLLFPHNIMLCYILLASLLVDLPDRTIIRVEVMHSGNLTA